MDRRLTAAVAVVADDLIWSSRISESIRRAGARTVTISSADELAVLLEATAVEDEAAIGGAVVDLNGRRYDGVDAIERVAGARLPVIAVARHDDQLTRKRALGAGALRVFSYDKFFRDGTRLVSAWLVTGDGGSTGPGATERA